MEEALEVGVGGEQLADLSVVEAVFYYTCKYFNDTIITLPVKRCHLLLEAACRRF